jgi:hypothetical protein
MDTISYLLFLGLYILLFNFINRFYVLYYKFQPI